MEITPESEKIIRRDRQVSDILHHEAKGCKQKTINDNLKNSHSTPAGAQAALDAYAFGSQGR
jgi:hypothetical protein